MTERPLDVVYNSSCPVCRSGVESYRAKCGGDGRARLWRDINDDPGMLAAHGVTRDDVRLKIHVVDRGGALLIGMPAIAAIWAETPGRGWLAALVRAPLLRHAAAAGYHVTAHALYRWNRAAGNY